MTLRIRHKLSGQVVGWSNGGISDGDAFLFSNGTMQDLATATAAGAYGECGAAVNDSGESPEPISGGAATPSCIATARCRTSAHSGGRPAGSPSTTAVRSWEFPTRARPTLPGRLPLQQRDDDRAGQERLQRRTRDQNLGQVVVNVGDSVFLAATGRRPISPVRRPRALATASTTLAKSSAIPSRNTPSFGYRTG